MTAAQHKRFSETFLPAWLAPLKLSKATVLVARYLKHIRDYETVSATVFVATIARFVDVSERTVTRSLRTLEGAGYFRVTYRRNNAPPVYALFLGGPPGENVTTPAPICHPETPKMSPRSNVRYSPTVFPNVLTQRACAREDDSQKSRPENPWIAEMRAKFMPGVFASDGRVGAEHAETLDVGLVLSQFHERVRAAYPETRFDTRDGFYAKLILESLDASLDDVLRCCETIAARPGMAHPASLKAVYQWLIREHKPKAAPPPRQRMRIGGFAPIATVLEGTFETAIADKRARWLAEQEHLRARGLVES